MAIATVEKVKEFAKKYGVEIRKFSDDSEFLVMYKAVRAHGRGGKPWSKNHQPRTNRIPYYPNRRTVASGLNTRNSSCCKGLHVTTLAAAKHWVHSRDGRYGSWMGWANRVIEVLVPIRNNIVIPTEVSKARVLPSYNQYLKIRCKELITTRVVPKEELQNV